MNELLRAATRDVSRFLSNQLPKLSPDWWNKLVIDRLSFQQQRTARERGFKQLDQFDFAALLRILDQNWFEISSTLSLPREARSWLKELQTVRNKWAHLSSTDLPPSESYRDADTLGRLLEAIDGSAETCLAVDAAKNAAMAAMSPPPSSNGQPHDALTPASINRVPEEAAQVKGAAAQSLFKVGDLVALRSAPTLLLPVIEVMLGGAETRYRVFQNGMKSVFYESQLQSEQSDTERPTPLNAAQLRARLTAFQILSGSTANLYSLRSGRVQFVPYQYRPVLKLIRADRPRLLVADEVGVGKTIEAGLIIKELRARMDIKSVLVICPKALVAEQKWFNEMKRFDEHFNALDGAMLRHCIQEMDLDGEWPEQHSKAILPFSLFDSDMLLGTPGELHPVSWTPS